MGIFGAAHGWLGRVAKRPAVPKIDHIYPTMTKLGTIIPYLKRIQKKKMNHVPLYSADISIFFTRNQKILLYQEIQI